MGPMTSQQEIGRNPSEGVDPPIDQTSILEVNGQCSKPSLKPLGIQSPNLRMVMEPKYLAEEVIVHPNHPLTS